MTWFTDEENAEFERVFEETYTENYKCAFCPNKDGCGYFCCPNQIAMGEEVCWEPPFEGLNGLGNVDLSMLSREDMPPGFIIQEGERLHGLIDLMGVGLPSVSILTRVEGGRCSSSITYVFVHPERRRLIAPVLKRLVRFAEFIQSVQDGSGDYINKILEADVDDLDWMVPIFHKAGFGESLLEDIVEYGNANKMREIISATPPETLESELETALIHTARAGDEEMTMTLILAGVVVDQQDLHGKTALMIAAGSGYEDLVQLLLNAGAGTHLQDSDGRTALDHAKESGHEVIQALLSPTLKMEDEMT